MGLLKRITAQSLTGKHNADNRSASITMWADPFTDLGSVIEVKQFGVKEPTRKPKQF